MRNKFVILSDIHFPYENFDAIEQASKFMEQYQPKYIILLGDVVDCYSLSRFDHDPKRILSLQKEFDLASAYLTDLRENFPRARIIYIEGNHEKRLQKYLNSHPEISSLRTLTIPELLGLDSIGVEYLPNFYLGDLYLTHGEIVRKYSGQSARGEMDKNDYSGVSAHTHRLSQVFKSTPHRELQWCECGCLCSLNPTYLETRPDWQNGFVFGDFAHGKATLHLYKI